MIPGMSQNHPSFLRSFGFAAQGFRVAFKTERNTKVMCLGALLSIIAGFVVGLDPIRWAIVLLCCGVVIFAELINTTIETVVDLVSPEFHPLAGRAKDMAAAAVYLLCLFVAIVGIIVFGTAIYERFF